MKKIAAMLAVLVLSPLGYISENMSSSALAIAKWHLRAVAVLFLWATDKDDEKIEA